VIIETINTLNKLMYFLKIALRRKKKQKEIIMKIKGTKQVMNILKIKSLWAKKLSQISFKKQS